MSVDSFGCDRSTFGGVLAGCPDRRPLACCAKAGVAIRMITVAAASVKFETQSVAGTPSVSRRLHRLRRHPRTGTLRQRPPDTPLRSCSPRSRRKNTGIDSIPLPSGLSFDLDQSLQILQYYREPVDHRHLRRLHGLGGLAHPAIAEDVLNIDHSDHDDCYGN